jgi:hypothetical protein
MLEKEGGGGGAVPVLKGGGSEVDGCVEEGEGGLARRREARDGRHRPEAGTRRQRRTVALR